MSTIEVMSIKGIRAFSPDNDEKITFYKPLTLIVGHNGAGKTTIIECLKMASTGDLPPNVRSGQNFIHDPKVAGEAEVKAQIKMCFNSQFKGSFMVIRNFSLSQKKKTLQFKALDNALSIWDPDINAYHALPQRCSNINQEVPFSMGVNKAILENVIFVHQEDSNWPLSEPSNVKKRFDDIFAATKYTKALEEIRKLKSKEQTEAKEKRLQLETLRSHRDGAHRLRNTILENEQSSAAHSYNIESLKLEIQKISSNIDALQLELKEISQKKEQVSSIKATYDILARKVEETKRVMLEKYSEDDLEASIQDLEEYQAEFNPRLIQMEESMQQLRQYIFEVEEDLKSCISEKENVVRSHGQVIGAAGSYRKSVATLHALAHEANNTFQLNVSVGSGDDSVQKSSVYAFMRHLGAKGEEIESQIRDVKVEQKRREESMQSTIDAINDAISAAKQTIRNSSEKVQANSQKSEALERQISQLQRNLNADVAGQLKDLQEKLDISQQELTQLEKDAKNLTLEENINNATEKIREADAKINKLRAHRSKLAAEGESFLRAKIMLQELDKVREKERSFRALHGSKVAITLGVLPSAVPHDGDELVDQFKKWLNAKGLEAESLKSAQAALLSKYSEIDVRLKSKENSLLKLKDEFEELSKTLNTDLHAGTSLSDKVKELQNQRDERVKKVNFCDAYIEIWEKEKIYADQHSSCISCERVFEGEDAKAEYVSRKQAMINELPQQVSQAQKEIQELESKLHQLKIIEPDVQRYERLQGSIIPALEHEVKDASNEFNKVRIDLEVASKGLEESISALESSKSIMHEVVLPWSHLMKHISEEETACQSRLQLVESGIDISTSIDDLDKELSNLESLRTHHQSIRDSSMAEASKLQEKLASARSRIHSIQENIRSTSEGKESVASLKLKLDALTEDSEVSATIAAEKTIQLRKLDQEKAELLSQKSELLQEFDSNLGLLQNQLNALNLMKAHVESLGKEIGDDDPDRLAKRMEETLKAMQEKKEGLESRLGDLKSELDKNLQDHSETVAFAGQVSDLLSYKKLQAELDETRSQMQNMGVDASVFEREAIIHQEIDKLQKERSSRQSEADISAGSYATIAENTRKAKERLLSSEYTNIDDRYLSHLTEVQSIELATADLEQYHKALERALLAFHAAKMADINKTIKELWQKTYRGVDIDYIQIKADTESATTRSSYNYRVVMYVGGAELDMRGRCSAGQKVLSCLIIRLALAENFCLNCGVLALDEPTTNLDADNSASLAEALKSLMVARRDFESFQLIVITHDEEFARRLGSREFVEHIWRITKDENQHSRIHRETIA